MLTVVSLRLLDHTLDGILDVVGLFFFNGLGLFNLNVTVKKQIRVFWQLTLRGRTSCKCLEY